MSQFEYSATRVDLLGNVYRITANGQATAGAHCRFAYVYDHSPDVIKFRVVVEPPSGINLQVMKPARFHVDVVLNSFNDRAVVEDKDGQHTVMLPVPPSNEWTMPANMSNFQAAQGSELPN